MSLGSHAVNANSQANLIEPVDNNENAENSSNIRGRIRGFFNSLKKPKTFFSASATLLTLGGGIALSSLIPSAATPVLLAAGGAVAGVGLVLGAVGLAMKAYQSVRSRGSEVPVPEVPETEEDAEPTAEPAAEPSTSVDLPSSPDSARFVPHPNIQSIDPHKLEKFGLLNPSDIQKIAAEHVKASVDMVRFEKPIKTHLANACKEMEKGRKRTHWSWFIFPQIAGLGQSQMNRQYAIRHADEAIAFISNPTYRAGYHRAIQSLAKHGRSALDILGQEDVLKLWASLTLFFTVTGDPFYAHALTTFFNGELDANTLGILDEQRKLVEQRGQRHQPKAPKAVPYVANQAWSAQYKDGHIASVRQSSGYDYGAEIKPIRDPLTVQRVASSSAFSLNHIRVDSGNITEAGEEIVVNAANQKLRGGGGIDKAIHEAAGVGLLNELKARYPQNSQGVACEIAEVCATHSHNYRHAGVHYLLHVTGPMVRGTQSVFQQKPLLQEAYTNVLDKAIALGATSVALPILSGGSYGYPLALACKHALEICGKPEYQHLKISFFTWRDGAFGSHAYDTMSYMLNMMKN